MRGLTRVAPVLLAGFLLVGCGGSDAGSGDSSGDAAADIDPAINAPCSEVWVEGKTLPADYVACDDGTDEMNLDDGYYLCADESEIWYDSASNTFAGQGEVIRADENSALYDALEKCGALDD